MEDIKYLDRVVKLEKKDMFDNYFNWLYPFTNENISGYFKNIDFNGKSVITPTGSGDHALNALLLGARDLVSFDCNPLAKYYSELKIAAIKTLSLEEFILFFYNKNLFKIPNEYLNIKTYNKIRNNLSDEYKYFWDYVFNKYTVKEIYNSMLFTKDFLDIKGLIKSNLYLQDNNYYKLREILNNKQVKYYDLSLEKLDALNQKFDIILLSNIPSFIDEIYKTDSLKNLRDLINEISKKNSKVVLSYMYHQLIDSSKKTNDIYNNSEVRKYFSKKEYEYVKFESAITLNSNSNIKKIFPKYDSVIIKKH